MCAAAAAACGTARAGSIQSDRPFTLVIGGGLSASSLELMNAVAGGFFAAEGLDARLQPVASGMVGIGALMSGHADLVRANGVDLARIVASHRLKLVAIGTLTKPTGYVLLSLAARPVRDAAGLRGSRIGIIAVGATTDAYLDLFLHDVGLPPDSVERQVVGATSGTIGMLNAGRIDGVMVTLAVALVLQQSGAPVVLWANDKAIRLPGRCLVTTREKICDDPDFQVRALRAIRASMREMARSGLSGPVSRAAAAYDVTGGRDMAAFTAMAGTEMRLWSTDPDGPSLRHDPSAWIAGCAKLAEAGLGHVEDPASLTTDIVLDLL